MCVYGVRAGQGWLHGFKACCKDLVLPPDNARGLSACQCGATPALVLLHLHPDQKRPITYPPPGRQDSPTSKRQLHNTAHALPAVRTVPLRSPAGAFDRWPRCGIPRGRVLGCGTWPARLHALLADSRRSGHVHPAVSICPVHGFYARLGVLIVVCYLMYPYCCRCCLAGQERLAGLDLRVCRGPCWARLWTGRLDLPVLWCCHTCHSALKISLSCSASSSGPLKAFSPAAAPAMPCSNHIEGCMGDAMTEEKERKTELAEVGSH